MKHAKFGIRLESLALPLRSALTEVSRLGVRGVQVDAVGELAPSVLSQTGRRAFCSLLRGYNLELTALGCPLRSNLDIGVDQQQRLEHIREVMGLSVALGPGITIVQPGAIPDQSDSRRGQILRDSLLAVGRYGDDIGARVALETGLNSGTDLIELLQSLDTGSLGVNFSPANMLEHGMDPYQSASVLKGRIFHSQVRDGRAAKEVPLGKGDIDWNRYLGVLQEMEYCGWLTIARESGENRISDIAEGLAFLRRLVG